MIYGGDDRYVGSIDLRLDPSDEGSAEVGFLVAPWARGKGYAAAAVRTICAWGFSACLALESSSRVCRKSSTFKRMPSWANSIGEFRSMVARVARAV